MKKFKSSYKFKLIAAIGAFTLSIPIKTNAEEVLLSTKADESVEADEEYNSTTYEREIENNQSLEAFYYNILKSETITEAYELVISGLHTFPYDSKLKAINFEIQNELLLEAEESIKQNELDRVNDIYSLLLKSPYLTNENEKTVLAHVSAITDFEGNIYLSLNNSSLYELAYEELSAQENVDYIAYLEKNYGTEVIANHQLIEMIFKEIELSEHYISLSQEAVNDTISQLESFILTNIAMEEIENEIEKEIEDSSEENSEEFKDSSDFLDIEVKPSEPVETIQQNNELELEEVISESTDSSVKQNSENEKETSNEKNLKLTEKNLVQEESKEESQDVAVEVKSPVTTFSTFSMMSTTSTRSNTSERDLLYEEAMRAFDLFDRWNASLEGIQKFPGDTGFTTALDRAAQRMLVWGNDRLDRNNLSSARFYFDLVANESNVSKIIRDDANKILRDVYGPNRDELFETAMRAFDVFDRWNASLEGIRKFPGDAGFKTALDRAAQRMLNFGQDRLNRNNIPSARYYFELVANEANVSKTLRDDASKILSDINGPSRDELYEEAMRAFDVFDRWNASLKGIERFPGDAGFTTALDRAAQRMLNFGHDRLNRNNLSSARYYFELVVNEARVSKSLRDNATKALNDMNGPSRNELHQTAMSAFDVFDRWNASLEGIQRFPGDDGFTTALNRAAQRLINFGHERLNRNNISSARFYFELVSNEPTVSKALRDEAAKVLRDINGPSRDELLSKAMSATDVFDRWNGSLEGIRRFSGDKDFNIALDRAAQRMLNIGHDRLSRNNISSARYYFELVAGEANVSKAIRDEATKYINALNGPSRNDLYEKAMHSADLFDRWNASLEGISKFPGDDGFKIALNRAAERMVNWGIARHDNKNYDGATYYYNLVINEGQVTSSIRANATQLLQRISIDKSNDLFAIAVNNSNPFVRFNAAAEGVQTYRGEQRFKTALDTAANDILEAGKEKHKARDFKAAINHYEFLVNEANTPSHIISSADDYMNLARNAISLVHFTYQTTHYSSSLQEAMERQMRTNPVPQTDMYGGGWQAARRSDVEYFLNPNNFIHFDLDKSNGTSVKVTASSLNVRSGPSTNHAIINSVSINQEFAVISQSNGWYQISVNGQSGWVSGGFVTPITQTKYFDSQNITGTVNTATLNVRSGPGTNHSIVRQVTRGQRFTIIEERDGWFNMRLNGQTGWVSRDFVTVSQEIPRDILQFLSLSGTSGISVADLNQELRGMGILEGQGAAFIEASRKHNINEIYLLAHALLETGNGGSRLATGVSVSSVNGKTVPTKTVYNMYGIAAYDNSPLRSGSEYAYQQGWDTVEKAIIGGAGWISSRYINHATYQQDTLYKMKWNPTTPGVHQYATDIGWAQKQTRTLDTLVELSNKYNLTLKFDIPVYR